MNELTQQEARSLDKAFTKWVGPLDLMDTLPLRTLAREAWFAGARAVLMLPAGWQLVPSEPTPAMCAKGFVVPECREDPKGVYLAMLAAAPKPSDAEIAEQPKDCGADRKREMP